MEPADAPVLRDLSDEDIVSRPLERPVSMVASTGIEFYGLERSGSIPIRAMLQAKRTGKRPQDATDTAPASAAGASGAPTA
jgi:hypothetical protein